MYEHRFNCLMCMMPWSLTLMPSPPIVVGVIFMKSDLKDVAYIPLILFRMQDLSSIPSLPQPRSFE
ncbi:hypothetical protein OXPF_01780 [Oxobacter pfennigii]|uniref:Uncharacterized protein n=1 Tax=Oxobacter pfennigii TaxID=36849 RepID=A0A0P9ALL0_9CLOT|nr:hypothetical protein OXPF_01780 [Oxobacter pfennigii]